MKYTIAQFNKDYPDDDTCLRAIFNARYGDLPHCPRCAVIKPRFYRVKGRMCFGCGDCGYQLYPLVQTIFQKSTTPLKSWFYAMYLFSASRNGVSAKELERHLGVTYKTAWRIAKQIRSLMAQGGILTGQIEVDETYIGGTRKLKEKYDNKQIVFGAVERGSRVRASHVRSSGARVLLPEIKTNTHKAEIFSDEARAYKTLPKLGYTHTTVNHSQLEYVRGTAHTNTIEGFWSQLKRSMDGTYHAVSPKYLQLYLDEFAFRYNYRGVAVYPVLVERVWKRAG